jgi:hypothetical protein
MIERLAVVLERFVQAQRRGEAIGRAHCDKELLLAETNELRELGLARAAAEGTALPD